MQCREIDMAVLPPFCFLADVLSHSYLLNRKKAILIWF